MLPKALDVSAVLPVPFGSAVVALHPDLAVGVDASWADPAFVASKNGMKKKTLPIGDARKGLVLHHDFLVFRNGAFPLVRFLRLNQKVC